MLHASCPGNAPCLSRDSRPERLANLARRAGIHPPAHWYRALARCGLIVAGLVALAWPAYAEVVRVEVRTREDVLSGRAFGLAGAYERLAGHVYFAVDPADPANRIITDIDKAPRNADGRVEFWSEFFILKPKDMARGNGAVLYEVGNRERKGLLSTFNLAQGSLDPRSEAHFGDGLLQQEGYTLVWLGWQFDVPREEGRMRLHPPVATENGAPIRGLVRSDFVVASRVTDHLLSDRVHVAYEVADPDAQENVMTVRDAVEAERRPVPRDRWGFGRLEAGAVVPDRSRVYLDGGFEPGQIYEVVYVSENPPLVGLGPTATRDLISYLKHGPPEPLSIPHGSIGRAIGFGSSQSGRFLRTFLYHGFNADEANRRVFDGVISHVAGGGRGSINHRFAQASRDAHPYMNIFYPTDIFPFTDVSQTDPETGKTAGLLAHLDTRFLPKVFYTNSSYEYWGRAASLIHTTVDGAHDATLLDTTRIYAFAGSQHGPARFPPETSIGQQRNNPMNFRLNLRALLGAMNRWTRDDTPPPNSQYPRLDEATLVSPDQLGFPEIPGVNVSTRPHKAYRADYGPRFESEGIVTQQPPAIGAAFPMMVTAVDEDGNEAAGIRLPEQSVPLATYTGWNLFNAESGPAHELSSMQGSYIPFPLTRAARESSGDPRRSIEERYGSRAQYLGLVSGAALEQIAQGYLLPEDMAGVVEQAGRHWDHLVGQNPLSSASR